MCGIAGVFSFKKEPVSAALLKRMNDSMTHRGPDAEGFYLNPSETVGLAMRRLKVIDLSTGDQPIHNEDKSLRIIFNGEIYNYRELREELVRKGHRFYTNSDTEVILQQYQKEREKALDSLVGMFAFAIYDTAAESLFLARDRMGIKPLFYYQSEEGVAFASEIKSILEVPWVKKKINLQAVSHFLSLNYLPSPWTPFEGIRQLPPGHCMKIEKGKVQINQYWEIPLEPVEESESSALKKIEALMHRSMERRLIADVPIGAFLSGGLDSSTLVYLMKEHKHERIKTFSVGFDHPSYDETAYAREVAKYFGTDHYEIRCGPEDVSSLLPKVSWHADNLLGDQAALPLYKVSKLAKEHVTVCLSGDGGDEIFIGYPTYHANDYHSIYSRIPRLLRELTFEKVVRSLSADSSKLSFEYKAKKFIEAGNYEPEKAHYWWRTIFTEAEKKELFTVDAWNKIQDHDAYGLYETYLKKSSSAEFENRCLFADMKVWLEGNNLYKVDTMTMAHGLEARVPFLDHELVEYMARLPISLKFRGRRLKYLLKKIMANKLPESVLKRRKAGWHTPIAAWFQCELKEMVRTEILSSSFLKETFRADALNKILTEHFSGRRTHSFKIWSLLVLKNWASGFGLDTK